MFIHIHCLGNKMKCYKHLVAQLVAIGCVMKLWHSMPWNKTFFFYLLGLIPLPLNPFHTECHCFFSWTSLVALPWSCCNQQLFFTNLEHTKCSSVSTKDVDNFSRRWGGFQEVKFHCKDPKQTSKLQQGCWSSCFFLKSMVWHGVTYFDTFDRWIILYWNEELFGKPNLFGYQFIPCGWKHDRTMKSVCF